MDKHNQSFRHIAILLFVSGVLLLSGLDKIDVNIMEARNFISAREMVHNNEYLLTTLNNLPRYEKPPLPTWLTALSGSVFGFGSLFAMRLPVVTITILLVLAFYWFSKLLGLEKKQALHNGLILVTSFYVFFSGRDNQWDMYTHSFMMVSILFLWKLLQDDSKHWRNSLLAGLFLGFSILSKGPVSFYAMFLPFLISYGIVYRIPFRKKWKYLAGMLMAGLIIGTSWYIYVRLKDPASFNVIASREAANWTSYEIKPFYYYWNFFVQSGLWAIPALIALIYPYMKSRVNDLKAYRFALFWTLTGLILLSLVPEKKVRYLVPVLIPLALTTGFYIEYLIQNLDTIRIKWEKNIVHFFSGLIAMVGFAFPGALIFVLKQKIYDHWVIVIFSSILIVSCAVIIVRGLLKIDFEKVFYAMIVLFAGVVISLFPLYKEVVYNPAFASTKEALDFEKENNVKTYSLSAVAPEIVWDFGKPIPILELKGGQLNLPAEPKFAVMVDRKDSADLVSLFPHFNFKKIYRINMHYNKSRKDRLIKDYYLFSISDAGQNH